MKKTIMANLTTKVHTISEFNHDYSPINAMEYGPKSSFNKLMNLLDDEGLIVTKNGVLLGGKVQNNTMDLANISLPGDDDDLDEDEDDEIDLDEELEIETDEVDVESIEIDDEDPDDLIEDDDDELDDDDDDIL